MSTGGLEPELADFLTATLSRAIRTPLHGLLGFFELLAMGEVTADQRRLLDQMLDSSEELRAVNDRLVLLLGVLGRTQTPRLQPVAVGDLVTELAARTPVAVRVHRAPGTPQTVDTDAGLLLSLLQELLANAVAHGRAPVALELAPGDGEGSLRIVVTDGGSGMPPAAQRQLHGPERPRLDGAGLLLVRELADLLGARCRVDAGAHGTRVGVDVAALGSVVVPAPQAVPEPPRREAAEPAGPAAPAPLTVLLVEDNPTNRLLAQRQLARLGHVLCAVPNGEAGVQAAVDGAFDVVLMDLHLPDIDGQEAARRIRAAQRPGEPRLPIVAITADATAQARESCLQAGMDDILTKPVDLRDLGAALERARALGQAGGAPVGVPPRAVPAVVRRVSARVDEDPDAVAQFVDTFLSGLPSQRLRLQAALRRGEVRSVLSAAHALRASSDTMGAASLAAACAALSAATENEHLDTARVFLPNLLLQCQQLEEELRPFTDAGHVSRSLQAAL